MSQTINAALRRVPPWLIYIAGPLPAAWWLYLGLTGGLGVEPINALERELGEFGLKLFILVLAITPLRKLTGINLIKFRRALGLIVFLYVVFHLVVWLFLDVQIWAQIWKDIVKRPYITIGMLAFVMLIPAAITSNNWSVRKLGPQRWKRWHWLTYPAVILGCVHFVMVQKVWEAEPLLYLGVSTALLASRIRWNQNQTVAASR